MARRGKLGGAITFLLGFLFGLMIVTGTAAAYLKLGKSPVAVADAPFPYEKTMLRHPVNLRIDHELAGPPFGTSDEVFEAGAHVYMAECASCHGTPGHDADFARQMYPRAPQLWRRSGRYNELGITEIETGRSYWKVANGIRLTGMPAYSNILTETQMWQVTLLLKHAGDKLPGPVIAALKR